MGNDSMKRAEELLREFISNTPAPGQHQCFDALNYIMSENHKKRSDLLPENTRRILNELNSLKPRNYDEIDPALQTKDHIVTPRNENEERVMFNVEQQDTTADSYISTDPDSGAQKEVKLTRFDLIPVYPLFELAKHYGRGAKKYAEEQWRGGYAWWKSYRAAMTHLLQFWGGEDIDEETGSPHLICVVWHCFALLEFGRTCPEKDTRPKDVLRTVEYQTAYTIFLADNEHPSTKLRVTVTAKDKDEAIEIAFGEWIKLYPDRLVDLVQCIKHLQTVVDVS
jgi:hypothetical protein